MCMAFRALSALPGRPVKNSTAEIQRMTLYCGYCDRILKAVQRFLLPKTKQNPDEVILSFFLKLSSSMRLRNLHLHGLFLPPHLQGQVAFLYMHLPARQMQSSCFSWTTRPGSSAEDQPTWLASLLFFLCQREPQREASWITQKATENSSNENRADVASCMNAANSAGLVCCVRTVTEGEIRGRSYAFAHLSSF